MKKILFVALLLPMLLFANEEAKYFFEEYKREKRQNFDLAERYLAVAIALVPQSEDYRQEEILYYGRKYQEYTKSWRLRIDGMKRQMKRIKCFQKDFHKMPRDIGSALLSPAYTNHLETITQDELAEMAKLCQPARKIILHEMSKIYFPHDPENVQSLKEFKFFCLTAFRGSNPAYYFDYSLWLCDRLKTFHGVLLKARELAKKHPQWIMSINRILAFCGDPTNLATLCDVFFPNYPFEKDKIIRKYLYSTTSFCVDALASPFPYAHYVAFRLEFMQNTMNMPRTKDAISQCFAQYFFGFINTIHVGFRFPVTKS